MEKDHAKGHTGAESEYEIRAYEPKYAAQVAHLLYCVWNTDVRENLLYIQWKYHDNPYIEAPLGTMALHHGEVVGFRGLFVNRLEIRGRNNDIRMLSPADACVHPAHRRRGLFVGMIRTAMKMYAERYPAFLTTTVNRNSLPGALKLGYVPLVTRVYASHCTIAGLARYALAGQAWLPIDASSIHFGRFDKIFVSASPRPEEMARLAEQQVHGKPVIQLAQDESFFRWRFNNPRGKYVFYYLIQDDIATAYVVIGMSPNNRRGYVLDYGAADYRQIAEILRYIIRERQFDILSIHTYGVDDVFWCTLYSVGFRMTSLVRLVERMRREELPLLIRPVKEAFSEDDFFIAGLDVRQFTNWSLKPICSDAV